MLWVQIGAYMHGDGTTVVGRVSRRHLNHPTKAWHGTAPVLVGGGGADGADDEALGDGVAREGRPVVDGVLEAHLWLLLMVVDMWRKGKGFPWVDPVCRSRVGGWRISIEDQRWSIDLLPLFHPVLHMCAYVRACVPGRRPGRRGTWSRRGST